MISLHKLCLNERRLELAKLFSNIDLEKLYNRQPFDKLGDGFVENYIGSLNLPIGFVKGLCFNKKIFHFPIAIEETSVVAALNKAAKDFRKNGQITARCIDRVASGHICYDKEKVSKNILDVLRPYTLEMISEILKPLFCRYFERGGQIIDVRLKETSDFYIFEMKINALDSMGANLICQMLERIADYFTREKSVEAPLMCILSNSMDEANVEVEARIKIDQQIAHKISRANLFAQQYPKRASTHNKGIMNGIDSVVLMSGNDWRAQSAMIHSYACKEDGYKPLTSWYVEDNELVGQIDLPMNLGIVGGVTKLHPQVKVFHEIIGIKQSSELLELAAVVGLLQNFSALRALVTDGIVKGHMLLHIDNIIAQAAILEKDKRAARDHLKVILDKNGKVSLSDLDYFKSIS